MNTINGIHEEFLNDLQKGEYKGHTELEYEIESHDEFVTLSIYDPKNFLTSYRYNDSCDAREDMQLITEHFGIAFKEVVFEIEESIPVENE